MEFDKVIEKRRSVRHFKPKKASWKAVVESADAARKNPYAGNKNNIMYVVTEKPSMIKKIADICEQDWILDASFVVVVCSEDSLLEETYGERGRIYSRQQAGAAIMTFLLKLVDVGYAACWVGAFNDQKIRDIFNIPSTVNIEALIPVGYEYGKTTSPKKRSLEANVFWEIYGINISKRRPTIFTEPGIHDNP